MTLDSAPVKLYSIYISTEAVILHLANEADPHLGKLFCSHNSYKSACQLALEIAQNRGLNFLNLVTLPNHPVVEKAKDLALI